MESICNSNKITECKSNSRDCKKCIESLNNFLYSELKTIFTHIEKIKLGKSNRKMEENKIKQILSILPEEIRTSEIFDEYIKLYLHLYDQNQELKEKLKQLKEKSKEKLKIINNKIEDLDNKLEFLNDSMSNINFKSMKMPDTMKIVLNLDSFNIDTIKNYQKLTKMKYSSHYIKNNNEIEIILKRHAEKPKLKHFPKKSKRDLNSIKKKKNLNTEMTRLIEIEEKLTKENIDLKKLQNKNLFEYSTFITNILEISVKNEYTELIKFLNPTHEEMQLVKVRIDLSEEQETNNETL